MQQDTLHTAQPSAQATFLFPTAPAAQDAPSPEAPSDRLQPVPPSAEKEKPAQSPLRIAIILALVTGLIGLASSLTNNLMSGRQDHDKARVAAREALRTDILNKSSAVVLALRAARKAVIYDGVGAAAPARARYDKAVAAWYRSRSTMIDHAQTLFGPEFAMLLEAPSGRNIITDRCGVVIKRKDPARATNCQTRLDHEVAVLDARQDAVNAGNPVPAEETNALIPGDFTTSLKVANGLIDQVSSCKKTYTGLAAKLHPPVATRCPNLIKLQYALNDRVNLLGLRQEAIAKALPTE